MKHSSAFRMYTFSLWRVSVALLVVGIWMPLSAPAQASGDGAALFRVVAEREAWGKIAARFKAEPVVKEERRGHVVSVSETREKGGTRMASVQIDKESGRVVEVTSNVGNFSDEEFALFTGFSELRALTLWHNSGYTGKGLAKVAELTKLERVTLAGGSLQDEGLVELAKFPKLKVLRVFHCRFSDAGVAALEGHAALENIELGAFWGHLLTDKTLKSLSTCPNLKRLSITETWLTWEGGLKHLAGRPLTELALGNCIIEPADFDKVKQALPKTKITWGGFHSGADQLKKSWLRSSAEKWIPKELLERVTE